MCVIHMFFFIANLICCIYVYLFSYILFVYMCARISFQLVCVCVYSFISFSPYVASSQHFCHLRKCCLDTYHVCWNLIAYCFQTPANNIRSYPNDSVFKRPKGWCFYFMDGQPGTWFSMLKRLATIENCRLLLQTWLRIRGKVSAWWKMEKHFWHAFPMFPCNYE